MNLQPIFFILAGYLIGSIPTGYLAGKWLKGMDLRRYGSGTISGSMVWEHVSRWAVFPVGIFDIVKGALPTWLGLELGLGEMVAVGAGFAAVAGHNWPLYLGFTGGWGLSPFVGILLVIFPWGFPWMLAFLAIGYLLGDSARCTSYQGDYILPIRFQGLPFESFHLEAAFTLSRYPLPGLSARINMALNNTR